MYGFFHACYIIIRNENVWLINFQKNVLGVLKKQKKDFKKSWVLKIVF